MAEFVCEGHAVVFDPWPSGNDAGAALGTAESNFSANSGIDLFLIPHRDPDDERLPIGWVLTIYPVEEGTQIVPFGARLPDFDLSESKLKRLVLVELVDAVKCVDQTFFEVGPFLRVALVEQQADGDNAPR